MDRSLRWEPGPDAVRVPLQNYLFGAHRIFVTQPALQEVQRHALSDPSRACFGFLLGGLFEDPSSGDPFLVVSSMYAAEEPYTELEETAELGELKDFVQEELRGRKLELLGWYHTHPQGGVSLSPQDAALHLRHFPEPWQCAVVVVPDPGAPAGGFFQRTRRGGLARSLWVPFYELLEAGAELPDGRKRSVLAWENYVTEASIVRVGTGEREAIEEPVPAAVPQEVSPPAVEESPTAQEESPTAQEETEEAPVVPTAEETPPKMDLTASEAESEVSEATPEAVEEEPPELPEEEAAEPGEAGVLAALPFLFEEEASPEESGPGSEDRWAIILAELQEDRPIPLLLPAREMHPLRRWLWRWRVPLGVLVALVAGLVFGWMALTGPGAERGSPGGDAVRGVPAGERRKGSDYADFRRLEDSLSVTIQAYESRRAAGEPLSGSSVCDSLAAISRRADDLYDSLSRAYGRVRGRLDLGEIRSYEQLLGRLYEIDRHFERSSCRGS